MTQILLVTGGKRGIGAAAALVIPMQVPGTAQEIAQAIIWRPSNGVGYVTDAVLEVSGFR